MSSMDETESLKEGGNHEIEKGLVKSEGSAPTSPISLLQRLKTGCSANGHQISVSFWSTLAFLGTGCAVEVYGATLLDLADHLSVGVGSVATVFAIAGIGAIVGGAVNGVLMDRMEMLSFSILFVSIFGAVITTGVAPVSVHLGVLAVIVFFQGAMLGSIDNGVHFTLMKMWKQKAGPSLQCIYFGLAVGGFIAPLIAKPFLSDVENDAIANNILCNGSNLTCPHVLEAGLDANSSYDVIADLCANVTVALNCTPTTFFDSDYSSLSFAWAFAITALIFIVPLVAFLYYAIRLELWKSQCRERRSSIRDTAPKELEDLVNGDTEKTNSSRNNGRLYKITVYSLLFLFLFFFEALQVAYGTLIFTVAVIGELDFSKDQAAHLMAVFWAAFAFMRVIPITLTLLKVPTAIIMAISLIGSLISTTVIMIFPHDPVVVWIGTAALGTFLSPASPTAMTMFNEYIEISGKGVAVLLTGYALGGSILPAIVGLLIEHVSPDSLFYFSFTCAAVSALLMVILFVSIFVHKRKRCENETKQYEKLN